MTGNATARQKVALLSVYSKEGIVDFASQLVSLGWQILASGGTCRHLQRAGVEVGDVADMLLESFVIQAQLGGITFSEKPDDIPMMMRRMRESGMDAGAILGHRVVTLSREVHAGLLARDCEEDQSELDRLGILRIDLVCCDFYPLAAEIAKPDATIESVVEQTDIGGPTMVRSAAKGGRIVICDPADRQTVIDQLRQNGNVDEKTRQYLRAKAEYIVAGYCLDSARFHSDGKFDGMVGQAERQLAYGENRDQSPATLFTNLSPQPKDPLALRNFTVVSGDPSYISYADGHRVLAIMRLLAEACRRNFGKVPYIAIACKHANPCGVGVDWDNPVDALQKAFFGDTVAVMGAEIVVNFPVSDNISEALFAVPDRDLPIVGRKNWGVDVVFAPNFSEASITLLGKRERRRLLANPALLDPPMPPALWMVRPVDDGWIKQLAPHFVFDRSDETIEWLPAANPLMTSPSFIDLMIAWAAAWRAISNTVALAQAGMLIGLGCGQQDRIACVQLCLDRAKRSGHQTQGSIFASDGFFPYAKRKQESDPLEGPELLVQAGCIGGVVPADGNKLSEVQAFFASSGLGVAYVSKEHRGFFGH
ncbi:MAG: hypothetical protein AAB358_01495 [Patescibacteria group bacterium]